MSLAAERAFRNRAIFERSRKRAAHCRDDDRPRCRAFFFSRRSVKRRWISASRCSRVRIFFARLLCSRCSCKACCAFVPMPLFCNSARILRCKRLGWRDRSTVGSPSRRGLKRNAYRWRSRNSYTSASLGSAPKGILQTSYCPASSRAYRPIQNGGSNKMVRRLQTSIQSFPSKLEFKGI